MRLENVVPIARTADDDARRIAHGQRFVAADRTINQCADPPLLERSQRQPHTARPRLDFGVEPVVQPVTPIHKHAGSPIPKVVPGRQVSVGLIHVKYVVRPLAEALANGRSVRPGQLEDIVQVAVLDAPPKV